MGNRIPEGFRDLTGERAAAFIDDRAGNHYWKPVVMLCEILIDGEDGCLGV